MEDFEKLTAEIVKLRTDVLYLVRLIEKLESKIVKLEQASNKPTPPSDPFAGKHIERL